MKTPNTVRRERLTLETWLKSFWFSLGGGILFTVNLWFVSLSALSSISGQPSDYTAIAVLGLIIGWALLLKGFLIAINGSDKKEDNCSVLAALLVLPMVFATFCMVILLPALSFS